jgi:hypothetical protein
MASGDEPESYFFVPIAQELVEVLKKLPSNNIFIPKELREELHEAFKKIGKKIDAESKFVLMDQEYLLALREALEKLDNYEAYERQLPEHFLLMDQAVEKVVIRVVGGPKQESNTYKPRPKRHESWVLCP